MTFNEWAWHQVQVLGDTIYSIKDENGENTAWVNERTGERFDIKRGE